MGVVAHTGRQGEMNARPNLATTLSGQRRLHKRASALARTLLRMVHFPVLLVAQTNLPSERGPCTGRTLTRSTEYNTIYSQLYTINKFIYINNGNKPSLPAHECTAARGRLSNRFSPLGVEQFGGFFTKLGAPGTPVRGEKPGRFFNSPGEEHCRRPSSGRSARRHCKGGDGAADFFACGCALRAVRAFENLGGILG